MTEVAAVESGIELTPAGQAYALGYLRPGGCPPGLDPRAWREGIETRIDRHLALVTVLLALLDGVDGDPDLEPALAGFDGVPTDDREGGDPLDEGELSLGWTLATMQDGRKWLANDWSGGDLEQEHDGREPDLEGDGLEWGEHDDGESDDDSLSPAGGGSGPL